MNILLHFLAYKNLCSQISREFLNMNFLDMKKDLPKMIEMPFSGLLFQIY